MTLQQHESLQSACGQHVPMIWLALLRIWAAVHPAVTGGSCTTALLFSDSNRSLQLLQCPTMKSSLPALDCCLNRQLMIRSHRQERTSLCSGHKSRQVIISCSAKLKLFPAIHYAITLSTCAGLVARPSSDTSCEHFKSSGKRGKTMKTTLNCEIYFDSSHLRAKCSCGGATSNPVRKNHDFFRFSVFRDLWCEH